MENLYEWITNPSTIINIVVFIFGIGTTWANLNNRIKKCEDDIKELKEAVNKIDLTKLETKLAKIEADLEWLKEARMKRHK